jgi:hypothetical protein
MVYETNCNQGIFQDTLLTGIKPINIENLMDYSTGISDSYYLTENENVGRLFDALIVTDEKQ